MKKLIKVILWVLFLSTQIYSQQLFAEAEFGVYKPQDEDYEFNNAARYGANFGVTLQNDIQVYAGYKLWSDNSSETDSDIGLTESVTRFNTLVLGGRKHFALKNSKIGLRIGAEYIMSTAYEEDDLVDLDALLELEGKGSGFSLEGGVVYNLDETLSVFAGVNYLMNDVVIDKIKLDGVSYTRQELGMSEADATLDMNGLNLKISVSYSLAGLLE